MVNHYLYNKSLVNIKRSFNKYMKKLLLVIFIFLTMKAHSQMLHFKVVNAESLKGIAQAQVTSSNRPDFKVYTSESGDLTLKYISGDTISIQKKDFHAIHLYLPKINVDTAHVITISMVPDLEGNNPNVKTVSGLPMFEYYFVHQAEEKNNLKVQVFENKNAAQQRQSGAFKIASVHLNDFHKQKK
jgi:hypothetical protein